MAMPAFLTGWSDPVVCAQPGDLPFVALSVNTDPTVVKRPGAGWEMLFSTFNYNDGVNFQLGLVRASSPTLDTPTRMTTYVTGGDLLADLRIGPSGVGFRATKAETASLVRLANGQHAAFFSGVNTQTYAIGRATTSDFITYDVSAGSVLQGSLIYDTAQGGVGGCLEPSVCRDPATGQLWMWYVGWDGTTFRVMHARSSDEGVTWTKHPLPVMVAGASGAFDDLLCSHVNVVPMSDRQSLGWRMLYQGVRVADYVEGVGLQKGRIMEAVSEDGIVWKKNPVPVFNPITWSCGGPSLLVDEDARKVRCWYFDAADDYVGAIMYAECPLPAGPAGARSGRRHARQYAAANR